MSDRLKTRLTSAVYDAALAKAQQAAAEGEQSLSLSGRTKVDVRLICEASVWVNFHDIQVDSCNSLELRIDDDGYHVVATDVEREPCEDIEEALLCAGWDPEDEIRYNDPDDFDYFEVVRIDEIDLDEIQLDSDTENAVAEWNSAAEEG